MVTRIRKAAAPIAAVLGAGLMLTTFLVMPFTSSQTMERMAESMRRQSPADPKAAAAFKETLREYPVMIAEKRGEEGIRDIVFSAGLWMFAVAGILAVFRRRYEREAQRARNA